MPKQLKTIETYAVVQDLISKGKSRENIMKFLQDKGISYSNSVSLYYQALKDLVPEENFLDIERKRIIQQNLDRLERIITSSISGNTGEKKVALQAIDTLNKMVGVYSESNKVTIAKNNEGEEIIQIDFTK